MGLIPHNTHTYTHAHTHTHAHARTQTQLNKVEKGTQDGIYSLPYPRRHLTVPSCSLNENILFRDKCWAKGELMSLTLPFDTQMMSWAIRSFMWNSSSGVSPSSCCWSPPPYSAAEALGTGRDTEFSHSCYNHQRGNREGLWYKNNIQKEIKKRVIPW